VYKIDYRSASYREFMLARFRAQWYVDTGAGVLEQRGWRVVVLPGYNVYSLEARRRRRRLLGGHRD